MAETNTSPVSKQVEVAWIAALKVISIVRPALDTLLKVLNLSSHHLAEQKLPNGAVSLFLNIRNSAQKEPIEFLRLKVHRCDVRVEFPAERRMHYENLIDLEPYETEGRGIGFSNIYDLSNLSTALCNDLEERLFHFPGKMECCSLQDTCKERGYCIARNQEEAASCRYKQALYKGLVIFKGATFS